ncbi:MAG: Txe/YoeB family addiction module toxin [Campylobacteraceae bacterium]|jgi:Txe/YoeB family toxin of toxin-antitoxin system|nr:Txe/YoeB family addiction module toxin [Campylobacteraceae bacterium]
MVKYSIVYTKKALKDIPKLKVAHLANKTKQLIELIKHNPFKTPPSYEKLQGDLQGAYSRRINLQHRLVYEVIEEKYTIKIISMWSHYE